MIPHDGDVERYYRNVYYHNYVMYQKTTLRYKYIIKE